MNRVTMRSTMAGTVALLMGYALPVLAQESSGGQQVPPYVARNAIYAELGGNGLIGSINYERIVTPDFAVRVGAGWYVVDAGEYPDLRTILVPLVPVMVHYFIGKTQRLELGAGAVFQLRFTECESYSPPVSCTAIKPTFLVGYRYEPRSGGIVFRAGFTPVLYGEGVYWGAGLSVGWAL